MVKIDIYMKNNVAGIKKTSDAETSALLQRIVSEGMEWKITNVTSGAVETINPKITEDSEYVYLNLSN